MSKELYEFIAAFAWPAVALIALLYVWRTDAFGKLAKISDAADNIKASVADLIDAQEKLTSTSKKLTESSEAITSIDDRLTEVIANVNSIRDQVDSISSGNLMSKDEAPKNSTQSSQWMSDMEKAWGKVNQELDAQFDRIDRRATASEAYALAHGNRKKKISYETAEVIGVLHSSIKSYRRRKGSLNDWLTKSIRDEFLERCENVVKSIKLDTSD